MRFFLAFVALFSLSAISAVVVSEEQNTLKASCINAPEALRLWVNGRAGTGEPVRWFANTLLE